jgi:hypothetical protein
MIKFLSTCSKAPLADRYMRGNEIMTAAKTVAVHENTILTPKNSSRNLPTGLFTPNTSKMKKPTTVGGSTKGRVRIPSINILTLSDFIPATNFAAYMPKKNVITMDTDAVLRDIRMGDQFILTS